VKSGSADRARSESRQRFNPAHFQIREAATTNCSLHDELFTGRTSITGKIRHATRADNTAEAKTGGIILRGAAFRAQLSRSPSAGSGRGAGSLLKK
jgi:hypothetical protein